MHSFGLVFLFFGFLQFTIRLRRLLFAGAMARQPAGRPPKRLMDGKLVGGEDPGKGCPEQNWMDCLKDDFQAFGATDGSTVDNRLTFGVDRAVWTLALRRRWTMGRRGTRGCCRERKSSWPPGTRKKRRPADDVRPNRTLVILSPPHICR